VTVNLVDADGNIVATTTTDEKGNYSFDKLPAGTYSVKVVKDGALTDLDQTEDPDGTKDSASEPIVLNEDNPTKKNVNFGYVNNNSLSGTVYRDDSRNGDQDGTEPGYSGVTVQLLDKDGNVTVKANDGEGNSADVKVGADGKASVDAKDSEGNSSKVESDEKGTKAESKDSEGNAASSSTVEGDVIVSEDGGWSIQGDEGQVAVQADGSWSIQANSGLQATVDASGEVTSIVGGEKADLKAPKVPAKPAQAKVTPVKPVQPKK